MEDVHSRLRACVLLQAEGKHEKIILDSFSFVFRQGDGSVRRLKSLCRI